MFKTVNQYCLDRIIRLSSSRQVVATEDIVAANGMKLWAKGKAVSAELQQRLLQRKLSRPLESALTVEQATSLADVVDACFAQMEEVPLTKCFGGTQAAMALLRTLAKMQLPPPVRLLLTAIREHDAEDYKSNLNTVLVGVGIASRLHASDHEAMILMLAALLHDFGLLYIDPALLSPSQRLAPREWKHVASHPIIGQMLVRQLTSLPPLVGECIALHHERLDGSGYPNYLNSPRINQLGAWLAVADSVSAMLRRGGDDAAARISLALKVIPEEFDRDAVTAVLRSLRECPLVSSFGSCDGLDRVEEIVSRLQGALDVVRACRLKYRDSRLSVIVEWLALTLGNMMKSLRATGVLDLAQLGDDLGDPELVAEIDQIVREVEWRMRSAARNVCLRSDEHPDLQADLRHAIDLLDGAVARRREAREADLLAMAA